MVGDRHRVRLVPFKQDGQLSLEIEQPVIDLPRCADDLHWLLSGELMDTVTGRPVRADNGPTRLW